MASMRAQWRESEGTARQDGPTPGGWRGSCRGEGPEHEHPHENEEGESEGGGGAAGDDGIDLVAQSSLSLFLQLA